MGNKTRGRNGAAWQRFEYDAAGRLVVDNDDAGDPIEEYTYGASRNRLINEIASGRTYYAWGGSSPLVEYIEETSPSTPVWDKSYVYAGSRLLSTATKDETGEKLEFHHPDRLGTTLVTDPAAGTSFRQSTLPFGKALGVESTGYTNQMFTSYDRSAATGLDYTVNRTYSPGQSRFTQVDPIGMSAVLFGNPQSNNLYAYVRNMPKDLVDPSGLYEACAHKAMTEFLAKLGGGDAAANATALGNGAKAADSFKNSALNPINAFLGFFGKGPSAKWHFPNEAQFQRNITSFSALLNSGQYRLAGFVLHSIEDRVGAHRNFDLPLGHSLAGSKPDRIIGDQKFIDASNKVLQVITGDNKRVLTGPEINALIEAVKAGCGKKANKFQITYQNVEGISGGGGGDPGPGEGGPTYYQYQWGASELEWLWWRYEQERRRAEIDESERLM